MREIVVAVDSPKKINLGHLGENNFEVVKFDITDWLRDHKNGKAVLLFKVKGMDAPYPCKVEIQGKYANWILTRADLQYGRDGKCQLFYYSDGEVVAKSSVFCTDVANSLGEQTTDPPESFTNWVNDVLTAGSEAEKAAILAKQIQQQMNETLQSTQQTFDVSVRQGLSSIEAAKEQVAQQAEKSVSRLDETANAAIKTVLDTLTEGLHQIDTAQTQAVTAVTEEGDCQAERLGALVPDDYYSKEESDHRYAQIDDAKTSMQTTWSSENIVQQLCQSFTVEGSIVTCNPVEGSQLNILAQIDPVQQGKGNPSPENVRPIQGWENVTIWRGGKNLLDINQMSSRMHEGVTFDVHDGSVRIYGTSTGNQSASSSLYFRLPTGSYIGNLPDNADKSSATMFYVTYPLEGGERYINTANPNTFNIQKDETGNRLYFVVYGGTTLDDTFYPQVEVGAVSTPYEPYRGETFTIPIGHTVYGGTLDVTTGILTKTHENIPSYAGEDVGDDWISSTGSLTLGAQVVYRLPQPEIIHLNPQRIYALSGTNTLYADSGNITISGYSDPKAIIHILSERLSALEQNAIGG